MYSDEDLNAAVKEGIFDEASVEQFRSYVSLSSNTKTVDEENFKLISGFNDIFVAIAALLLLFSAGWLGSQLNDAFGYFVSASLSWLLSIHFISKKKLALPAIFFLISFIVSAIGCTYEIAQLSSIKKGLGEVWAFAAGAIAAYLHWYKFKVPVTVAAGIASASAFLVAIATTQIPFLKDYLLTLIALSGVMTFFIAMYWDSKDKTRTTRKSDVAFWLHLLSAPLIVHPVFSSIGVLNSEVSFDKIAFVVFLYFVLALVSVAIDRRALMVSSLVYVLYALTALFEVYGTVSSGLAISGVFIGSMLLLLSAFWQKFRVFLLRGIPEAIRNHLPV
jgi:hypothetical protein